MSRNSPLFINSDSPVISLKKDRRVCYHFDYTHNTPYWTLLNLGDVIFLSIYRGCLMWFTQEYGNSLSRRRYVVSRSWVKLKLELTQPIRVF